MSNQALPFSSSFPPEIIVSEVEIAKSISSLEGNVRGTSNLGDNIQRIISCLDLTNLNATDTAQTIDVLVQKAKSPLADNELKVAAVCVYQPFVKQCLESLKNTEIEIATVAGGFPAGQMDLKVKCADIQKSVTLGATEIDMVINRSNPLTESWEALYNEVRACKSVCGNAHLKVIIATGELETAEKIAKTSWICMLAGADFIKTSTGMEKINATYEAGLVMMRAIKSYEKLTGVKVGFKPAGGIRTTEQALGWLQLIRQELGEDWANKKLFRIGASSLLDDLRLKFSQL